MPPAMPPRHHLVIEIICELHPVDFTFPALGSIVITAPVGETYLVEYLLAYSTSDMRGTGVRHTSPSTFLYYTIPVSALLQYPLKRRPIADRNLLFGMTPRFLSMPGYRRAYGHTLFRLPSPPLCYDSCNDRRSVSITADPLSNCSLVPTQTLSLR